MRKRRRRGKEMRGGERRGRRGGRGESEGRIRGGARSWETEEAEEEVFPSY